MRDNAKAMIDLQKQRSQDAKTLTAIEAIKSYVLLHTMRLQPRFSH
jgi:hypothetical protein